MKLISGIQMKDLKQTVEKVKHNKIRDAEFIYPSIGIKVPPKTRSEN